MAKRKLDNKRAALVNALIEAAHTMKHFPDYEPLVLDRRHAEFMAGFIEAKLETQGLGIWHDDDLDGG